MINKLFYYLKRTPKYFLYPNWMIYRLMNLTQDDNSQKQDRLHQKDLIYHKLPLKSINFIANDIGTYAWNLFKMVENKEQYDVIYLDGHHTFYIDLPAIFLSDILLEPGGILMVDDIEWTLNFMKNNMKKSFLDWYFYRNIYNFSDYDKKQQSINHIGMIIKEILINNYKYKKLNQFQSDDFVVLQKPKKI